MTKQNKIIVAVSSDSDKRLQILKRLVVEKGFAKIPSDAEKLIAVSISDINIQDAYFVICDNVNLRDSPITRQRLYELSARGMAVIIGTRKLSTEFEFICEAYYE